MIQIIKLTGAFVVGVGATLVSGVIKRKRQAKKSTKKTSSKEK